MSTDTSADLTWRPLARSDVTALTTLSNLVTTTDGDGRPVAEETIAQQFDMPRFVPERHTIGVWHAGLLIGTGSTFSGTDPHEGRALVSFGLDVHPDHRTGPLGEELLGRTEALALALAAERFPGLPVRLRTQGGQEGSWTQQLLEARGYRPDNYFITMEADLPTWVDPGLPSEAVAIVPELVEATRDAHNDAFRDHRNFTPIPADTWSHWLSGAEHRPALGRVVVEDGRVLAYAVVSEYQPGIAHVELVGTRREARGRGLARQVLLGTIRAARDAGMSVSELEVDSTSPTGADRLYTSIGYRPVRTISRYQRLVD